MAEHPINVMVQQIAVSAAATKRRLELDLARDARHQLEAAIRQNRRHGTTAAGEELRQRMLEVCARITALGTTPLPEGRDDG